MSGLPDLISAALLERDGAVLAAHRKAGRPPLAGQWLLPIAPVRDIETAEEALRRHVREQFDVAVTRESFVDTVYLEDPADGHKYVANVFRAELGAGPMRFRADGDYDDARWLTAQELSALWMPPPLRDSLVRVLTEPESTAPVADWTIEEPAGGAPPLAERGQAPAEAPAPDNRAGWNAIAKAYQRERYGDRDAGRLKWSRGVFEDELRLLGDVRGARAIVLGSGGGQDCIALDRMGATAVGIDVSREQIAYAKAYAARHGAANASFVEGNAEDLSRFDDASFDLAISVHALQYVERADRAFMETARVLKPGAVFAFCVPHPLNMPVSDEQPYCFERSYWEGHLDWEWAFENGTRGALRDYCHTVSGWLDLLADAGFALERLVEPYQGNVQGEDAQGFDLERARLIPWVMIVKARKR